MITAYAVPVPEFAGGGFSLIGDKTRADEVAARHHSTVHKLVEEAPILRKFDGYVPADQASGMRYRILELESQVAARQRALQLAHARLTDMLMGDDGQAWREAERAMPEIAAALTEQPASDAPLPPWSVAARQVVDLMTAIGRTPTEEQEAALSAAMCAVWPRPAEGGS